ncbi:hypothetical protein [Cohaesibacter haloalkalitolerans]|uniref:hypothetical protein n=1 Tax=Cohaesibacter haloalkalitolerans TaxID=1162980 RepID=UPI000E657BA0|nr:hypothetical protein [Cohaesibacter haloalkalitolerans]
MDSKALVKRLSDTLIELDGKSINLDTLKELVKMDAQELLAEDRPTNVIPLSIARIKQQVA